MIEKVVKNQTINIVIQNSKLCLKKKVFTK